MTLSSKAAESILFDLFFADKAAQPQKVAAVRIISPCFACLLAGASAGSGKGETDPGKQLLLAHLADRRHGDTALSSAAIEFMLCQSFASVGAQFQKTEGGEEEQASLLVDYRMQLTSLRRPAASPLTESEDL